MAALKSEQRICFGIEWFGSEAEAEEAAAKGRAEKRTYNGGFFDGRPCGRDPGFDRDDPELGRLYAVTC